MKNSKKTTIAPVVTIETTTPSFEIRTVKEVRKMNKEQLFAYALTLNILTQDNGGLDRKKIHVQEDVLDFLRENGSSRKDGRIELTEEMKSIIEGTESKSQKMRMLSDLKVSIAQIAEEVGAHYSFAHSTVTKHEYQKSKSENKTIVVIPIDDALSGVEETVETAPIEEESVESLVAVEVVKETKKRKK